MIRFTIAVLLLAALATNFVGGCAALLPGCQRGTGRGGAGDFSVTYQKTGGFMPFNDSLVVHGDGVIVFVDRSHVTRKAQVTPEELAKLQGLLASPEFQGAAGEYRTDRGADLVTHTIDARVGSSQKTVVVMTATEHPKVLDQVIAELERLAGETK